MNRLRMEISTRPAALRAQALKGRLTLKTELDEEARRILFRQNAAQAA